MPVINGKAVSWSNIEPAILRDGKPARIVMAFRGTDYDDTNDGEVVRGAGYDPIARTDGNYVPGGMSMMWLSDHFRQFAAEVVGTDGLPLSSYDFVLQINKRFRGSTVVDFDKVFFSFNSLADSMAQGSGAPLETTIGCLLMRVERWFDGKKIVL